jgi:predicted phosphate transport protein (TIGR00153 family)
MRLIPREEKFFTHFSEQTNLIVRAAQLLHASSRKGNSALVDTAEELRKIENQGDEILHEIYKKLNQTFITPLDPEDIHNLGAHLDDVLDGLEEVAHRIVAYKIDPIPPGVIEMCSILESCSLTLAKAFEALSSDRKLLDHCIEVNQLEDRADAVYRRAVPELFDSGESPITVMKLKEIYDLLESTADYCEDVADALQNVEVKNS